MVSTILEDLQRHCWGIPARSIYIGRFCRKFLDEFHLVTKLVLQENSATAGIHLRPGTSCETIWDPMRPSKTIWDYLRLSKTIWDHPRQSEAMWDYPRPSKTLWDPLRPSETLWDLLRPSETIWGPLRTRKMSRTTWGRVNASIHSMGPKVFFAINGIILLNEGIVSFQFTLQWRNNPTVTFCDKGVVL